ncbi:GNAT family N-acetyltransferase [Deinococcus altitudinis]|uniref:GNAT family N-acetyltransferase n=1 Tax=Deinococcus altitudinis TaxID=468914 RepID=UPI0038917F13
MQALAELHAAAFGYVPEARDAETWGAETWGRVLARSLCWVTAHQGEQLTGFVNVAWDDGLHAFLLDAAVHPGRARRGVGTALVKRAAREAALRGAGWLHVDYEPHLEGFYRGCGFGETRAGLLRLN